LLKFIRDFLIPIVFYMKPKSLEMILNNVQHRVYCIYDFIIQTTIFIPF